MQTHATRNVNIVLTSHIGLCTHPITEIFFSENIYSNVSAAVLLICKNKFHSICLCNTIIHLTSIVIHA